MPKQKIDFKETRLIAVPEYEEYELGYLDENVDPNPSSSFEDIKIRLFIEEDKGRRYEIGEIEITSRNPTLAFASGELVCSEDEEELFENLILSADAISQELSSAAGFLYSLMIKNKKNRTDSEEECAAEPRFCYISKLYIYPEFRNMGLGSYMLKNIHSIIPVVTSYSHEPNFYIAVVNAFFDTPELATASDGEKAEMDKIIVKTAEAQGFQFKRFDEMNFIYKFASHGE